MTPSALRPSLTLKLLNVERPHQNSRRRRQPTKSSACETRPVERHWAFIGGLDFGWDHPTAAVKMGHDRDNDVIYVIGEFRLREA
jgi:hypothetical protein